MSAIVNNYKINDKTAMKTFTECETSVEMPGFI